MEWVGHCEVVAPRQMLELAIQSNWYLTQILAFGRILGIVGNSSIHTHHLVRAVARWPVRRCYMFTSNQPTRQQLSHTL